MTSAAAKLAASVAAVTSHDATYPVHHQHGVIAACVRGAKFLTASTHRRAPVTSTVSRRLRHSLSHRSVASSTWLAWLVPRPACHTHDPPRQVYLAGVVGSSACCTACLTQSDSSSSTWSVSHSGSMSNSFKQPQPNNRALQHVRVRRCDEMMCASDVIHD